MLAHGVSLFLKERMVECADLYQTRVCGECGLIARRMLRKNNRPYETRKDIWYCPACRNTTNVHMIRVPYAFKLLIQELMAMSIAPRIRVKESKYNE